MASATAPALDTIGVPKEIKGDERRVALTPDGAAELVQKGCQVLIEHDAGRGSGFLDEMYISAGAHIVATAKEAWAEVDNEIKKALWRAPTKGGIFTTKEIAQMKSNE